MSRRFGACAAAVLLAALAIRVPRLGERPYHHDEAIHGYDAWQIARVLTHGSQHDHVYNPTYHGPLRYYLTAAVFAVVGDGDAEGRALPVAFGVALVGLALAFRRELGDGAAATLGILLAASPLHVYYSRFLRDDPLVLAFTLAFYGLVYRGLRERRLGPLVIGSACLGLAFASMENGYIVALTFAAPVVTLGLFQVACRTGGLRGLLRPRGIAPWRLAAGHAADVLREWPGLVQGLLWLLGFACFNLLGAHMADLEPLTRALAAGGLVAGIGAVAGSILVDHARRGPPGSDLGRLWTATRGPVAGSAAFALVFSLAYTNAFTHPSRLGAGLFSALEYWSGQQARPRLDGPFLYYVPLLLLHEPVVLLLPCLHALRRLPRLTGALLALLAGAATLVGIAGDHWHLTAALDDVTRRAAAGRGPLDLAVLLALSLAFLGASWRAFLARDVVLSFSWLWALGAFAVYAWAREKVPWLGTHVQLPLAVVTALLLRGFRPWPRRGVVFLALLLAGHSRWLQVTTAECNTADPIVYVQTVPRLRPVLAKVDAHLAEGRRLVLQSDLCVPFYWYFRRHGAVYPERIDAVQPFQVIISRKGAEGAAASLPRRSFYYYHSQIHEWARTGMGMEGLASLADWLPAYLLWRDQTPFWKGGYQASLMVDPAVQVHAGTP